MKKFISVYKWASLPLLFCSASVLAGPVFSQQHEDPQQTNRLNQQYIGGKTQIGGGVTDKGNVDIELQQVISEGAGHSTNLGLWGDFDVAGDKKGLEGRGGQISHNWVSRDDSGRAMRVNKLKAAYDRNAAGHEKATLGYGQENENLFWEGRVSKGLSDGINARTTGTTTIKDRAYEYGVGASIGTFLPNSNVRVRGGLDHEWSSEVGQGEDDAQNTTLSAGVQKHFSGTGHSVSLDVSGSKRSGGYRDGASSDDDYSARLGYQYDFAGANAFQSATTTRRVRVEVPQTMPTTGPGAQQFKRVPTFKTIPVYGKKIVKTPYKRMVKSTMGLEGQTFFKLNSAKLIPSAQKRLTDVANEIRKSGYKGAIRITGNTCGLGSAHYDQILSERRARAVRQFLIKKGFNPDHLIARGLGKSHPKFRNVPGEGFKNRRVDIEYVAEVSTQKTAYRTEEKRVQTGTRKVASGFKNVPIGPKNVMIDSGQAGAPRIIWRTETINNPPAWIQRALHTNIRHDRHINTFQTTANTTPTNNTNTAVTDNVNATCGMPITLDVLSNDTNNSGSPIQLVSFTQASHGSVTQGQNGQLIYTANGTGCGQNDSFTYTIDNGSGGLSTATVNVTVAASSVIDAANETTSIQAGQVATIDVLNNDGAGAQLTSILTQPNNGSAQIVNGQVVYTPNSGFVGVDTFVYEITDSNGNRDTAEVTVNVNNQSTGSNSVPLATNDQATTAAGQSVILDSLSNDRDSDGDVLVIESVSIPANGTAVISNGKIIYTPNAGFTGTDTFTYVIYDGNGGRAQATETITVTGHSSNTAPIANNDTSTVLCSGPVTINVLANDSDAENNPLSILDFTQPSHGTLSQNANGELIYTSNGNSCNTNDTFTYRVTDGVTPSNPATVTIAIGPAGNNAPVAVNDSVTTPQGTPVTISSVSNDTDADGDSLTITNVEQPLNGTVTQNGQQITYTPNAGFVGVETFTYTITDNRGGTSTATETVTVTSTSGNNTVPVANNDSATTAVNTAVTLASIANDTDADGDSLTITSVQQPLNGTVSHDGQSITYTPNTGYTGTDTFTYAISDGNGGTATATETVTITSNNTAPVANNDSATTPVNTAVTLSSIANDTDADGDSLTITSVQQPLNGTVSHDGQSITYTPNAGYTGTDTFTYTISDGNGGTATATETVTITSNNTAPVANNDSASAACAVITINALANDTDAENDSLTIVSVSGGTLGTASVVNNQIVYTPASGCDKETSGTDTLSYTISDGTSTASANVEVIVQGTDDNQTQANSDSVGTDINTPVDINVLSNDSGTAMQITELGTPSNGTVEQTGGIITYTPNIGFEGQDSFHYKVESSDGSSDFADVTITVATDCTTGDKCN